MENVKHFYFVGASFICSVLLCGFISMKQVLEDIFNNLDQKAKSSNKAYGLILTMNKLETGIMTSQPDKNLNTGYALLIIL